MSEIELKARELLASCLNEWGHHQEAGNIRDGDDLESYEFELRVIGQLLRFGFDTGHGHATRAQQWLPIESAPKDGTAVLATSAHMTGPNGEPVAWAAVFDQERGRWTATWDGEPLNDATHWQPLPAPLEVSA